MQEQLMNLLKYALEGAAMNLLKYALEGAAVAVAAYYIPKRKANLQEIAMIAATAAVVFMLLDTFAPAIGEGARLGSGFGIGASQVGYQGPAMEGMCGDSHNNNDKSDKQPAVEGMCGGKSDKFDY